MGTKNPNRALHCDGFTILELKRRDGSLLYCVIDTADYELVRGHRWSVHVKKNTNYAETRVSGKKIRLHQLLLPDVSQVDHEDGNGLNNRRLNIRPASDGQNCANRKKASSTTSSFKGVNWRKDAQKWRAEIRVNGVNFNLGCFINEEDAARAYNAAAVQRFGEFAKLNDVQPAQLKKAA